MSVESAPPSAARVGPLWLKVLLAVALAAAAWSPWLDQKAQGYYEQAFARALVTFGLARALNGVISVIQGTELSLQPAGVGVTLTPGQLIDPVNDLIERFSWIMLASSTALGSQKILMDISAWWGIAVVVSLAGLSWLVFAHFGGRRLRRFALRFFLLALFLRFAMPAMVMLNEGIYSLFMAQDYLTATAQIEQTRNDLEDLSEASDEANPERGLFESLGDWFGETSSALNVRQKMAAYKDRLAGASEQFLKLAAVFLLQTMVLPLLFLWGFAKALRNIGALLR